MAFAKITLITLSILACLTISDGFLPVRRFPVVTPRINVYYPLDQPCEDGCGEFAHCVYTIYGQDKCACLPGYFGDGKNCTRIVNECDRVKCHENATCSVFFRKPICRCLRGYRGNGFFCQKYDPCLRKPCHFHATCTALGFRYRCNCNRGYFGNGHFCYSNSETSIYSIFFGK